MSEHVKASEWRIRFQGKELSLLYENKRWKEAGS